MWWIQANTRNWRKVILILLVLAILGPWAFDKTNVPAQYACGPTSVRLEGDFCGHPTSGIQILFWMIEWLFVFIIRLISREADFVQEGFNFWIVYNSLILILLILPIINILVMIFRGAQPRLQKFHLVVCGLNLAPALLVGLSGFPNIYFVLWGTWLYILSLISILILEAVLYKQK
jgi:hypothetical protein